MVKNKLSKKRYAKYSLEDREPVRKQYINKDTYSIVSSIGYRGEE